MLSVGLQALASSSMCLFTYLPSSEVIKKIAPKETKKGNSLQQICVTHG
jgi:hypothetical protein